MGVAPLTIVPCCTLAKFLFLVLINLCSFDIFQGERAAFTKRHNNNSMNWKLKPPSSHLGLFKLLNHQSKKRVMVLTGVTNPDYQVKLDCYSTMEIRKSMPGI